MNRRRLLQAAAGAVAFLAGLLPRELAPARAAGAGRPRSRVRPGDPAWPSEASWERLGRDVGGRLVKVRSPLAACRDAPASPGCAQVFTALRNPYFLGDEVGLTQSLGWVDAWTSRPSVYAVAARTAADVAAAVNFARENNLRLVVKGGGHSYQGTSCAPDSLLVWTRGMNAVTVHDAFVGVGCAGRQGPQPAVTVGAGALWGPVYDAVATKDVPPCPAVTAGTMPSPAARPSSPPALPCVNPQARRHVRRRALAGVQSRRFVRWTMRTCFARSPKLSGIAGGTSDGASAFSLRSVPLRLT